MHFGEMMWTKLWQERKDFVIVTLRDYYYHEYAIDMRQIRELLKEDFVESMLQADQGESEEMTQTSF